MGSSLTRRDIETKLQSMGDYVRIDFLNKCLKDSIDFDTRKFVQVKLSQIYEQRGMTLDAARILSAAAEINSTFQGKINDYLKSAELFVKAGNFDDADVSLAKAIACANGLQKESIKQKRKQFYLENARSLMKKENRRKHSMEAYEKVLSIEQLTPEEKREAQSALLVLYEKLGKIKEFYNLKRSMSLS